MGISSLSLADIQARYFAHRDAVPPPEIRKALAGDERAGARRLAEMAERRTARRQERLRHARRLLRHEQPLWDRGLARVAGVDEAGVGPLAGPVVAAAVVLPPGTWIEGLDDSKKLSPAERGRLFETIRNLALGWSTGISEAEEVDRINVYQAGLKAMSRAVSALPQKPEHLLVDARRIPGFGGPQEALVRGDSRSASIAAASVMAKVTRDAMMEEYDRVYPGYGFARHKGYGTAEHRGALRRLGRCPIHRKSFIFKEMTDSQTTLFSSPSGS
jgi:ribonuclease HII